MALLRRGVIRFDTGMIEPSASPATVGDLMTPELLSLEPGDPISRARDLMLAFGINALPVMEDVMVVGIVTSSDLVDDWPDQDTVSTIMSTAPFSIRIDASLREAAEQMVQFRIHHLLVESDGLVAGILSSLDLLEALASPTD